MQHVEKISGWATLVLLSVLVVKAESQEWHIKKEAGGKAFEQGRYSEAEALGRAALAMVRRTYSEDRPEVAGCLNDLAVASTALGKYRDAEDLYRKALIIWEKNPGNEPSQARVLSNLSVLLRSEAR